MLPVEESLILYTKATLIAHSCWLNVSEGRSWTSMLSWVVSTSSQQDRVSVGAICVPGRAQYTILKS